MSKYIKTPAYPDSMPVDISFVFEDEKPAGKRGFLKPNGDHFVFEDGSPARFWGVNFNGGANFPEHEDARKVARRLAQAGCNIVRFHQLDAEWDTPNIYAFTKGKRVTTTRKLDPESMDRLDYLIYCLKEQGIYVYFDMMTYRKFKSGDGVELAKELKDSAKPYSIVNRRMIELQKEFCDQIWNRYNPYTKMLYKDDPVFAMTEITNECDLFDMKAYQGKHDNSFPYVWELRLSFKAWLEAHGMEYDWENCELWAKVHPIIDWKLDVTKAYYQEMYDYMRQLGVKIPITGTNWLHGSHANAIAEENMDFSDGHHYYYDWRWGEEDKFCCNEQINGYKQIMANLGTMRLDNMPYFVSEWDMPWPNSYRAEGPIYYAAVSALQDWAGMAIHTYAYNPKQERMDILGKEVSSSTIGGVPYREGIFSVWNDPAKFGLFQHASLIVRRADISPANKKVGCTFPQTLEKVVSTAYQDGLEKHRLVSVIPGKEPVGCDEVISIGDHIAWEDPNIIMSDNGQMWRNISKKFGGIDTERTKVIYGKLTAGRNANAGAMEGTEVSGMKVVSKTDFAVVALSSLSNDPIEKSDNMLLTTIGRARNTDQVYDGDKMIDYGTAPILSEVITATISIKTERDDLMVWGVNAEGFYVGKVPTTYADGVMTFTVGEKFPASYYLIVAE